MKGRLRWLAAVLLLAIPAFVMVAFVFRDFVRQRIVIPVIYMAWLSGRIFNSIPQIVFLLILIVIGVMLAIGSLRYLLYVSRLPTDPPQGIEEPTRYQFWHRRCQKVSSNAFFLTSLGIELRRFVLMVVAYQEHVDMWELERQISHQEFEVPYVVYDLVSQRNLGDDLPERSLWDELLERLFGASQAANAPIDSLGQRLNEIVNYLEYRLEVKHDRRDS